MSTENTPNSPTGDVRRGFWGVKTIWKYPLKPETKISMPTGAAPLAVQMQGGTPTMWALVDPDTSHEDRFFTVLGTGHDGEVDAKGYIGTWQDGSYVFHLFDTTGNQELDHP